MLAALDSVDDIGARSLYTTLLDFAQDYKFDHDLVASVSEINVAWEIVQYF